MIQELSNSNEHVIDSDELEVCKNNVQQLITNNISESTIVNSYQRRVEELFRLKEEISVLKSQLSITKDNNKLLEAEFAFRKDEYEQEINKLKQENEQLLNRVCNNSTKTDNLHTNSVNEVECGDEEMYKKEIQRLQEENEKLLNIISSNNSVSGENTENEIKRLNGIIEDLSNKLKLLSKDRTSEGDDASILMLKINRRDEKIKKLVEIIKQKEEEIEALKNRDTSTLGNEDNSQTVIKKLYNKVKIANEKLKKAEQIEVQNEKLSNTLSHFDTEREVLNDIFQVTDENPEKEWTNLRNKAKKVVEESKQLKILKKEYQKLNEEVIELKKLEMKYEDLTKRYETISSDNQKTREDYQKLLQKQVDYRSIENDWGRYQRYEKQQRIRMVAARVISSSQRQIIDLFNELYDSLSDPSVQKVSSRPLILCVVFLKRWCKIASLNNNMVYDEASLVSYAGSPSVSLDVKVRQIKEFILKLSEDLFTTKSDYAKSQEHISALKKLIIQQQEASEESYERIQREREISTKLKKRMKELQVELSSLVSQEKSTEIITRVAELEIENERLKNEYNNLQSAAEEYAITADELHQKAVESDAARQNAVQELERIRKIVDKHEMETEVLESRLRAKTRDMLALERFAVQTPDNPFSRGKSVLSNINDENKTKIGPINIKEKFIQ